MSKIAGELNAEMMGTINSATYQAWLNSPLTKALKRSFEQSITDPENQPSQYGTVTLAMYEHLEEQITSSQQRVAELEKDCDEYHQVAVNHIHANEKLTAERDKATQYWQIAEGRCDALMKQRDELVEALERTLPAINDIRDLQVARAAIASVKEKA